MGNSLSERIAKNQRNNTVSDNSKNKVAFLALKDDIESALKDGWSKKAIWETLTLEEKISFSYKTFCLYVSRLINTPNAQEKLREDKQREVKPKNEIKGFTYNPVPNPEELF
jgi:hypothetical protein|tara:strand:+ start:1011 stop:1346 length:336 start_codon:yes stop_codon:yes gene_type:complete